MNAKVDEAATFTEVSYALIDESNGCVLTTQMGNLAIFSVHSVAQLVRMQTIDGFAKVGQTKRVGIQPVRISRTTTGH